jgi:cysteine desulfuration protein SufE
MTSIKEEQNLIVEEFSVFDDWMDKYEYLIELGKSVPIINDKDKTDSNIIKGCQSRVWLSVEFKDGKLFFKADSDAIITKGIISLLIRVYSEREPNEILNSDLFFLEEIGLKDNLSPTRANGLLSMINQIKYYALLYAKR